MTRLGRAAIAPGALVPTARGLREARQLEPGETIFTYDLQTRAIAPVPLRGVTPLGRRRLVEVRVRGRTIRLTPGSALLGLVDRRRPGRLRRRFSLEWISAAEVRPNDIVASVRATPDLGVRQQLPRVATTARGRAPGMRLPEHADEDLLWWCGLYIGDGYLHHDGGRHRVEFAIPASQPDLRAELAATTARLFGVASRAADKWRVAVPGVALAAFVIAAGLAGKAAEKRIPRWVFASPEPHRLAFLGGYVDADGDIRATTLNKDMGLTSVSRSLLDDARRLALQSGIRTSRIWEFRSRHPTDPARTMTGYRLRFSGDFDRVRCRSERRLVRMRQRRFFHSGTAPQRTTVRAHTSRWIGFEAVAAVTRSAGPAVLVRAPSGIIVADGLVVRLVAVLPLAPPTRPDRSPLDFLPGK